MSFEKILSNLTPEQQSIIIESLMFYASCDVSSDVNNLKIDTAADLAVELAKAINFKSEDMTYIGNEDIVYEDRHIIEKFKQYIKKEILDI